MGEKMKLQQQPDMKQPDFLIIGAMKCGTTSLHHYLGKHPNIFTTTPKEIHYFSDPNYQEKEWEEYLRHFQTDKKLAGASPQNYTKRHRKDFGNIPPRLYQHLPDVKLIYILRDPIERIYSHYYEAQEGGYAPPEGLNAYLQNVESNHYVLTSAYFYQLRAYLEYFPREQIHLLTLEQLRDNRLETLNEVFRFLGVPILEDESLFQFQSNSKSGKTKATSFGELILSGSLSQVRSLIPRSWKSAIKESDLFRGLTRTPNLDHELIQPDLEQRIRAYLQDDLAQLRAWWGKDISEWSL
jgi:hypothetical protein